MPDINEPQLPETSEVSERAPSAPEVPKGIMSAGPSMTTIQPQQDDEVEQASQAVTEPEDEDFLPDEEPYEETDRVDYLKSLNKQKKSSGPKKWQIILIVMTIIELAAVAGYWFLIRPDPSKSNDTSQQASDQPAPATVPSAGSSTTSTSGEPTEYASENFPISMTIPADWTPSDSADKLTFTSPVMKLTDNTGSTVSGAVIITVRNQQTKLDEFKDGNATAVLESDHLVYSSPAPGQRDSTYLSFLQYAGTTVTGSLDAMYITGNAGYQKGQNVPEADVTGVDPLITVSFVECDTKCSDTDPPVTISSTMWTGDFKTTIETILKSIQITA
ncbi:hypothetical protein KDA23_04060 [Candidatus Saccharibacteria bacterium]|nr:hypothetical protein [Candidatus Saccharibacteria bacterium]